MKANVSIETLEMDTADKLPSVAVTVTRAGGRISMSFPDTLPLEYLRVSDKGTLSFVCTPRGDEPGGVYVPVQIKSGDKMVTKNLRLGGFNLFVPKAK